MSTIYQTKAEALATEQRIRDIAKSAYLGIATTTTTPPATGAYWYRVDTAGTYTNFKNSSNASIVVSAGDLDGNDVTLEVKDNVATKYVKITKVSPVFDSSNNTMVPTMKGVSDFIKNEDDKIKNGAINNGVITWDKLSQSTKDIINSSGRGTITNQPDEEDLTKVVENGIEKLKFADRPNTYGLGYKILRKNIVGGKNVLTQAMISSPNTIYEVRYNFDLNGATITVPTGCKFIYAGGTFKNGIIVGDFTSVNNPSMFTDCDLRGTWNGSARLSDFTNTSEEVKFLNGIRFDTFIVDRDIYLNILASPQDTSERFRIKKNLRIIGENNPTISYKGIGNNNGVGVSHSFFYVVESNLINKNKCTIELENINVYSKIDDDLHPNSNGYGTEGKLGWWCSNSLFSAPFVTNELSYIVKTNNVNYNTVGQCIGANTYDNGNVSYYINNSTLKSQVWPCIGAFRANALTVDTTKNASIKEVVCKNSYLFGSTFVGTKNSNYYFEGCNLEGWFEVTTGSDNYDFIFVAKECNINGGVDNTRAAETPVSGNQYINGKVEYINCRMDGAISNRRINKLTFSNCTGTLNEKINSVNLDIYRNNDVSFLNCKLLIDYRYEINYVYNRLKIVDSELIVNRGVDSDEISNINNITKFSILNSKLKGKINNKLFYFDKKDRVFVVDSSLNVTLLDKDSTNTIHIEDGKLLNGTIEKTFPISKTSSQINISFDYENYKDTGFLVGILLLITDSTGTIYKMGHYAQPTNWTYNGGKEIQENLSTDERLKNFGKKTASVVYTNGKVFLKTESDHDRYYQFDKTTNSYNVPDTINITSVTVRMVVSNYSGAMFNPQITIL